MADLLVPWRRRDESDGAWYATFKTDHELHLLLTVFQDAKGLWHGLVEMKFEVGPHWRNPSPFATDELAKQWAEGQAEKLRDLR